MELIVQWMDATGSLGNIPSGLAESLTAAPHLTVLADAGLEVIGSFEFVAPHRWSPETLAGFAYSTSVLSRSALGDHIEAFERDLRERLLAAQPDGDFQDQVSFKYDLAVKPYGS
jgi:hypothetical protein